MSHEFDQLVCKQFGRGCNEESLLLKLRLDEVNPPCMELITQVRMEKARRTERRLKFKEEKGKVLVSQTL